MLALARVVVPASFTVHTPASAAVEEEVLLLVAVAGGGGHCPTRVGSHGGAGARAVFFQA